MGKFTFQPLSVPGLVVIEPTVFGDERGFFMETWRQDEFAAAGMDFAFVQDNHSKSRGGVLRGLHLQWENTQGKLVRVLFGRVFDVGVDVRPGSPYFGRWAGVELTAENKKQLYVPPGFAHGFLVLSNEAEFVYKCTDVYNPAADGGIRWDDGDLAIDWPDLGGPPLLSEKDKTLPGFKEQDFSAMDRFL